MTGENAILLKEKLLQLGFEKVINEIDLNIVNNQEDFTIYHAVDIAKDQLMYALNFQKDRDNNHVFTQYVLGIRHIPIPEVTVGGINSWELEEKMIKVDELYNQYLSGNHNTSKNHLIEEANNDLMKLYNTGKPGKEIAELIMFKYWPEEERKRFIKDESTLRENYEAKLMVPVEGGVELSATEAYEKIKEMFSSPQNEAMEKRTCYIR